MSKIYSGISRRTALTATGALLAARLPIAISDELAAASAEACELVVAQHDWSSSAPTSTLEPWLATAARQQAGALHTLVLLPRATTDIAQAPEQQSLMRELSRLAARYSTWLAGAAPVRSGKSTYHIGFVIDASGDIALICRKATPDVLTGFSDASATLEQPADITAVLTPFGKLGLLIGEDLLIPGLARSAMLAGAELLLNPASGAAAGTQSTLCELPSALAYENWCTVAVATPPGTGNCSGWFDFRGNTIKAPPGETLLRGRFEVTPIRLARARISPDIYDNFPTWLRDELYGEIFHHQAKQGAYGPAPNSLSDWRHEAERRIRKQAKRQTGTDELEDYFLALIAQPATVSTLPQKGRRRALSEQIDVAIGTIGRLARAPNARLALFPEFCFTGAGYRSVSDTLSVAVEIPGPEVARLQEWARGHRLYCAAQFLETEPDFPDRVFNTAVLIDDSGEVILKHRKLQCVDIFGALPDTTPGSIYDDYIAKYGIEDLYAVADTPLGKIGVIICFEINMPEIVRAMARQGVEMILHLTAEGYGCDRRMWHALRRKRAYENQVWLLCANQGWDVGKGQPWVPYGESQIIDFRGRERDRIDHNGPGVLIAPVDMAALRAARRDPQFNLSIWDEPGAYAGAYRQGKGVPNNLWLNRDPLVSPYTSTETLEATRERYYASETYIRPAT